MNLVITQFEVKPPGTDRSKQGEPEKFWFYLQAFAFADAFGVQIVVQCSEKPHCDQCNHGQICFFTVDE